MKKRAILFSLLAAAGIFAFASGPIEKAKDEIHRYNYSKAVMILQRTLKKNDPKTKREATLLLADCYRKMNDVVNARDCYSGVVELGAVDPINYFYYAQALRSTGDYQRAKQMFLHFDSIVPDDQRGKIFAGFCDSVITWMKNKPSFDIKNAAVLNSKQSDFGPAFYQDGIIYTSDRDLYEIDGQKYGWTGNNYLHAYYSEPVYMNDYYNEFRKPRQAPGLFNAEYHDGPATFDKSSNEAFITRTYIYKDKGVKDPGIRTHLLKIFTTTRKNGKWSKLTPFFLNNDQYSVGHPALSPDGKTLYFVSDIKGGSGGTDIYSCSREDGKWSNPENLGPVINTFGNEMFPFCADNGDLYFASDGLPGYGGLDIFVTRKIDGKWTRPRNLGRPVNSSYDDFALAFYKNTGKGLFSSNRPGGKGADDLYCMTSLTSEIPKEITPAKAPAEAPAPASLTVSGCVKDKNTHEPVPGAVVFMLDNESGKALVIKTNSGGCFKTPVKKGMNYSMKAMQTGYIADCLSFILDSTQPGPDFSLPRDLLLDKLTVNRKFKLENIYYDFNKSFIRKDAEPSLNNLVTILKENPITVELGSHTDSRGSDQYNLKLSQRRAEAAVHYIVSQGIDPKRITAHGYGETQLVNRCRNHVKCSAAEHQANRRTEFKILSVYEDKSDKTFNTDKFRAGEIIDIRFMPDGFFSECPLEKK